MSDNIDHTLEQRRTMRQIEQMLQDIEDVTRLNGTANPVIRNQNYYAISYAEPPIFTLDDLILVDAGAEDFFYTIFAPMEAISLEIAVDNKQIERSNKPKPNLILVVDNN
jgi:hypothetical protein